MRVYGRILVLFGILICVQLNAQETSTNTETPSSTEVSSSEQTDRDELLALREALIEAVLAGDVDKQIEYVHDNVVTTWQNNQVARGSDGLRNFMKEMNAGGQKVFQGYTVRPTSDEVMILEGGNTAIAFGKAVPHYKLMGLEFDLENRWTATLVKDDGKWRIAAYHVSGNILDNPVLTAAKKSVYWVGGISLAIGLLIGAIGAKVMGKKPGPAA